MSVNLRAIAVKRLTETLQNAGIPIVGTGWADDVLKIEYAPEATPEQITQGQAILAGFNANTLTPREQVLEAARLLAAAELANFQTTMDGITTNYPSGATLAQVNLKLAADHQMVLALARIVRWMLLRQRGVPSQADTNILGGS